MEKILSKSDLIAQIEKIWAGNDPVFIDDEGEVTSFPFDAFELIPGDYLNIDDPTTYDANDLDEEGKVTAAARSRASIGLISGCGMEDEIYSDYLEICENIEINREYHESRENLG